MPGVFCLCGDVVKGLGVAEGLRTAGVPAGEMTMIPSSCALRLSVRLGDVKLLGLRTSLALPVQSGLAHRPSRLDARGTRSRRPRTIRSLRTMALVITGGQ